MLKLISFIIILIILFVIYFCNRSETFELKLRPCISRQSKLLLRVTELLWYYPNNINYQKLQWILWHNNLTTSQLNDIEKQLP